MYKRFSPTNPANIIASKIIGDPPPGMSKIHEISPYSRMIKTNTRMLKGILLSSHHLSVFQKVSFSDGNLLYSVSIFIF